MNRRPGPLLVMALVVGCGIVPSDPEHHAGPAVDAYEQEVPGTTATIKMLPISSGSYGFWMASTEITWDGYDVFVYGLDVEGDPARRAAKLLAHQGKQMLAGLARARARRKRVDECCVIEHDFFFFFSLGHQISGGIQPQAYF